MSFDDRSPIYQQIADKIKRDILHGDLSADDQVMSTNQYAAFYRINPATAAKGFHQLLDEGYLADMAHRRMISAARQGIDELELAERMARILDRLPSERERDPRALRASHRKLVAEAAELMVTEGYGLGLEGIAGRLRCSPHHLSRVFHNVMGQTLSAYRNQARVRQVLADLEQGDRLLRDLAARYGFADQAHMIRVVRRHAGDSPGTLKKLLRA